MSKVLMVDDDSMMLNKRSQLMAELDHDMKSPVTFLSRICGP